MLNNLKFEDNFDLSHDIHVDEDEQSGIIFIPYCPIISIQTRLESVENL